MNKTNYAGIPDKYARLEDAKVVLIPVPYDGTSTWQKGADKGPKAFLEASENMELFDIETRSEPYKKGIYLAPAVLENSSPEKMVETVYKTTKNYIKQQKFVTLFGGEHSISIGSIKAFVDNFEDLTVLQLDAHADLREEYDGSKCNHACAVYQASQTTKLIQVGIRSMDKSELNNDMTAQSKRRLSKVVAQSALAIEQEATNLFEAGILELSAESDAYLASLKNRKLLKD